MFHSYEKIFSKRANAYQKAMELYPSARDHEFQLAVDAAEIKTGDVVCDAPAGGGYLRSYLPADVRQYLAVETAADFVGHCPTGKDDSVIESQMDEIAIDDNSVDACINLAGAHHMEDKTGFFREVARILKPGGRFVMADVAANSDADRFLNQFVHRNNSMGHEGVFLDGKTTGDIIASGFKIRSDELIKFAWCFETTEDMGVYCKLLFGMDLADSRSVIQGIEEKLGYSPGRGKINMAWSLRCIVSIKA